MKTKRVATLNVGKFKSTEYVKKWKTVLLIGLLFAFSCSKSDDLELINDESPGDPEPLIIYTNIEPDFNSENLGYQYNLDINNDYIVDFTLSRYVDGSWEWLGIFSNPDVENRILSVAPWYSNPIPLDSGMQISSGGYTNGEYYEKWGMFTIGDCFGGGSGCYSDWLNKGEKYLGLRFQINGKMHYGWVRMEILSTTQWVIKDYAYNDTPNKPIIAGQRE